MINYVLTIEYVDGVETKHTMAKFENVKHLMEALLLSEVDAKQIRRVVICPRHTP